MVKIETEYSPAGDKTFIMADHYDEYCVLTKTECVGWYYGPPDPNNTKAFTGKLTATYK